VAPPACVVRVELPPSLRAAHCASLPIATTADATVGDVKAKLETALGVKVDRQTLYCQTSSTAAPEQHLSDERALKGLATLQLSPEWSSKLCVEDAEHWVSVVHTNTIGAVKTRVSDMLGMPAEVLTLSHDGRPLHAEEATLQWQDVPDDGVLTVHWHLLTLRLALPPAHGELRPTNELCDDAGKLREPEGAVCYRAPERLDLEGLNRWREQEKDRRCKLLTHYSLPESLKVDKARCEWVEGEPGATASALPTHARAGSR
jgi:hypothetical protein